TCPAWNGEREGSSAVCRSSARMPGRRCKTISRFPAGDVRLIQEKKPGKDQAALDLLRPRQLPVPPAPKRLLQVKAWRKSTATNVVRWLQQRLGICAWGTLRGWELL